MGLLQGDNQKKTEHQQKVQKHLQSNYVYAKVSIDNYEHIIQFPGNITTIQEARVYFQQNNISGKVFEKDKYCCIYGNEYFFDAVNFQEIVEGFEFRETPDEYKEPFNAIMRKKNFERKAS